MRRYLTLYGYFLRFSFSRAMEFRVDFLFRVVMDIVYYAVNLAFFGIIYRHTALLGGWNLDQVLVFVCCFLLADAIHMTVTANNLWWLPIFINRGDLDYYLVRPVSSLFFLSLREFAASSFLNVLIAAGLLVWALTRYPDPWTVGRLALLVGLLLVGVLVGFLVHLLFVIPVFWLHSDRGLHELYYSCSKMSERPHQVYHGWLRRALLSVLPLALISSVPAHAFFDGPSADLLLHVLLVTGGLFAVTLAAWSRGLRAYTSASS
jgi:ABC-2 type transport system permease protein